MNNQDLVVDRLQLELPLMVFHYLLHEVLGFLKNQMRYLDMNSKGVFAMTHSLLVNVKRAFLL